MLLLIPNTNERANAIQQKITERYDTIVNKSSHNMSKCIEIVNKLEVLKSELVMLLKSINSDATGINNIDNPQSVKEILKNISTICKLLQETISEKNNKEETAVKLSEKMQSGETDIIGKYEAMTKILVSLHERIYKLIIKFNILQNSMEDTMAEITHDLRNINSTMNSKEERVGKSTEDLTKLKSEVKDVVNLLEEGMDECKKHFDDIEKSNKSADKKPISDKKNTNLGKSDTDKSAQDKSDTDKPSSDKDDKSATNSEKSTKNDKPNSDEQKSKEGTSPDDSDKASNEDKKTDEDSKGEDKTKEEKDASSQDEKTDNKKPENNNLSENNDKKETNA